MATSASERTLRILLQLQADVDDVTKVKGGLKEIQTQAMATAAAVNSANQPAGAQATWQQLATQRAAAAPIETKITAEVERRRGFLKQEFEIAAAIVAGDTVRAALLRDDLRAKQLAVVYAKQLVISEAEALQLAQHRVLAENEVAAAQQKSASGGKFAGIGNVLAIAGLVGFELLQQIARVDEEALKIEQDYQKLTAELARQVEEWTNLAQAATSFSDVVNLSKKVEPELNKIAAQIDALNSKQISWLETAFKSFAHFGGEEGAGLTAAEERANALERLQNLQFAANAAANISIDLAQEQANAFQALDFKPLSESVAEYTAKLANAQAELSLIDRKESSGQRQRWEVQAAKVEIYRKALETVLTAQQKLDNETDKLREQIRAADLANLDPAGRLDALSATLTDIQSKMRALGVEAKTPNEALEQAKNLAKDNQEEVIKLANAWSSVIAQIGAAVGEQAKLQAQLQALNDQLAVDKAIASGSREEAFKAEWGVKYNKILAERQRIGADTSAQAINDQIFTEQERDKVKQTWAEEDRLASSVTNSMREQRDILHEITSHKNAISEDPFLTQEEKNSQLIPILMQEAEQLRVTGDAWGAYRAQQEAAALTFGGTIQASLFSWVTQLGTIAQQTAQIITGTLSTAISGAAQAITGLLFQTKNLGQAAWQTFQSIVQQIIQMGIQMLVTATLGRILGRQRKQEQVQENAEILASATPAAAAQTGATSGSNWIIGAIAAAVAIGAIIALLAGGFAEGGRIPGPLSTRDNRLAFMATGETVINAPASAHFDRVLGRDWYAHMNNFRLPARMPAFATGGRMGESQGFVTIGNGAAAPAAGELPPINLKMVVLHDKRSVQKEILNSPEAVDFVLDVYNQNLHRLRKS